MQQRLFFKYRILDALMENINSLCCLWRQNICFLLLGNLLFLSSRQNMCLNAVSCISARRQRRLLGCPPRSHRDHQMPGGRWRPHQHAKQGEYCPHSSTLTHIDTHCRPYQHTKQGEYCTHSSTLTHIQTHWRPYQPAK